MQSSARGQGPLARGAATHIEYCVRSIYSSSGAASLATLVVPHSAMSVGEAWTRVTISVWWSCGNPGVELQYTMCNVGCSFCLFVCFTSLHWSVLLRNTEGRLSMGTSRRHGLCYLCAIKQYIEQSIKLPLATITSQRLLHQSQAGVYWGKRHIPPNFGLFGPIRVPYPKGLTS